VVELLRINPNLDARTIRRVCEERVPRFCGLNSQYITNIRRWALKYNLDPDTTKKPTLADFDELQKNLLSKKVPPAWMEYSELADDSLLGSNFMRMLEDILGNSSDTWEVLQLLQRTKDENAGFDFRIRKTDRGAPSGICFITNKQRQDLLRYGKRFMCLDMQLKQFNA
jgi:hypothetical protein